MEKNEHTTIEAYHRVFVLVICNAYTYCHLRFLGWSVRTTLRAFLLHSSTLLKHLIKHPPFVYLVHLTESLAQIASGCRNVAFTPGEPCCVRRGSTSGMVGSAMESKTALSSAVNGKPCSSVKHIRQPAS